MFPKGQKKIKKGELVFPKEKVLNKLLFVTKGLIRSYRRVDEEELTYYFFAANDFACDFASFLDEKPTSFIFEALTETSGIEFNKSEILDLYRTDPKFEKLGRLMAERAYLIVTSRLKEFQTDDLETRYLKLMNRSPELFLTVPQRHIASMLGLQPQSLSRIKAKLAKQK